MKLKEVLLSLTPCLMLSCSQSVSEPEMSPIQESNTSMSRYLSSEEAAQLAADFMTSIHKDDQTTRGCDILGSASVELLNLSNLTRAESADTIFYVVNFEKGGYSIVAADRELENNVYVYSDTGEFELTDNPIMDIYLENAIASLPDAPRRKEVEWTPFSTTRAMELPDPDLPIYGGEVEIFGVKCKVVHKFYHSVKGPLLSTFWHQNEPYNICCPKQDGVATKVGCIAVAIGQICAYHRFPESIDGLALDWEKMLIHPIHDNEYYVGIQEVADFLHRVGIKSNIEYGVKGSGASINDAVSGLKRLGFSSVIKKKFDSSECVNSLRNNAPVFMCGDNYNGDGHAWVVDGCDYMDCWSEYYRIDNGELYGSYASGGYIYLHFNTGWKFLSDNTYYLCSGMDAEKKYENLSVFEFSENNQIITYCK